MTSICIKRCWLQTLVHSRPDIWSFHCMLLCESAVKGKQPEYGQPLADMAHYSTLSKCHRPTCTTHILDAVDSVLWTQADRSKLLSIVHTGQVSSGNLPRKIICQQICRASVKGHHKHSVIRLKNSPWRTVQASKNYPKSQGSKPLSAPQMRPCRKMGNTSWRYVDTIAISDNPPGSLDNDARRCHPRLCLEGVRTCDASQ